MDDDSRTKRLAKLKEQVPPTLKTKFRLGDVKPVDASRDLEEAKSNILSLMFSICRFLPLVCLLCLLGCYLASILTEVGTHALPFYFDADPAKKVGRDGLMVPQYREISKGQFLENYYWHRARKAAQPRRSRKGQDFVF